MLKVLTSIVIACCLAACNLSAKSAVVAGVQKRPAAATRFADAGSAPQKSVVYLCQASGSMIHRFGDLQTLVKESIEALNEASPQRFNWIFMVDEQTEILFPNGCQPSTAENKRLAFQYVDNGYCTGACSLAKGAQATAQQRADLVVLFSNGYFMGESSAQALEDFKPVFANGGTMVNSVCISTDGDAEEKAILMHIAIRGRGTFHEIIAKAKPN